MSDHGNGAAARTAQDEAAAQGRAQGLETGWTVFSYLLAGMAAYGGIGWLIGRAVHVPVLFPIGMLVGLAIVVSALHGMTAFSDRSLGVTAIVCILVWCAAQAVVAIKIKMLYVEPEQEPQQPAARRGG